MKKVTRFLMIGLLLLTNIASFAQEAEMADTMRSEGKIYVVVAIILVIFFGMIGFLIYTDRKVSSLEKRMNDLK
ncbi:MAG: CcmD family protein [Bacteroidetes bacterium]|nr:CcmD family protein [Bacteroidota bacterium]